MPNPRSHRHRKKHCHRPSVNNGADVAPGASSQSPEERLAGSLESLGVSTDFTSGIGDDAEVLAHLSTLPPKTLASTVQVLHLVRAFLMDRMGLPQPAIAALSQEDRTCLEQMVELASRFEPAATPPTPQAVPATRPRRRGP